MAAERPLAPEPRRPPSYSRFIFRAPSTPASLGLVGLVSLVLALLVWSPTSAWSAFQGGFLLVFLLPGLLAALLTPAFAGALGGRIRLRRSVLLAATAAGSGIPLLLIWRLVVALDPSAPAVPIAPLLLFLTGPILWFRHMSLFGVSQPSHARSIGPSLLQPLLSVLGIFLLYPPTAATVGAAAAFLLISFGCVALLLRASDRPLRREFGVSGVSLIRPLLDHINLRDPGATETLEGFFSEFAKPANLRVSVLSILRGGKPHAVVALPSVHPGPFAALGGSDLPRKLSDRLESTYGTVLVPHTPCNHDLDLPSGAEVDRVVAAAQALLQSARPPPQPRFGPLVSPRPGSVARAQLLGDTALVLVSQAPAPTDDIDYSVVDGLISRSMTGEGPRIAVIDAHNSYVEDEGDVTYGTPSADRLVEDALAAVAAAVAAAQEKTVQIGAAVRTGYTIGQHGIGPAGIRALVVRTATSTSAYVLLDGNNLLQGMRGPILERLRGLVDEAEVMTTDNHVVHEVDGSINPLGERFPVERLAEDVRAVVEAALSDLAPCEVAFGTTELEGVPVLGPGWTARLLTSLGDTVSMFGHAFVMTFLLLLTASLVVLSAFL